MSDKPTIFVVEQYHDNDAGIFSTLDAAVKCASAPHSGAEYIVERELQGDEFVEIRTWTNEGNEYQEPVRPGVR